MIFHKAGTIYNTTKENCDMSKKNLLNEATVRRFQALANIPAIGELPEGLGAYQREDEEELPGGDMGTEPQLGDEGELGGEEELGDEDELGVEDELGGEEEVSPEVEALSDIVAKALVDAEAAGDLEISVGEEEGEEELGGEELGGEELGGEEEGGGELEDLLEAADISVVDNEALVNEITRRVARRLLDASKIRK